MGRGKTLFPLSYKISERNIAEDMKLHCQVAYIIQVIHKLPEWAQELGYDVERYSPVL